MGAPRAPLYPIFRQNFPVSLLEQDLFGVALKLAGNHTYLSASSHDNEDWDHWRPERVPQTPESSTGLLESVRDLQLRISSSGADFRDEPWGDVSLVVPESSRRTPIAFSKDDTLDSFVGLLNLAREEGKFPSDTVRYAADLYSESTNAKIPATEVERHLINTLHDMQIQFDEGNWERAFLAEGAESLRSLEDFEELNECLEHFRHLTDTARSSLGSFIKEFKKYPLLSREEEQGMGRELDSVLRELMNTLITSDGAMAAAVKSTAWDRVKSAPATSFKHVPIREVQRQKDQDDEKPVWGNRIGSIEDPYVEELEGEISFRGHDSDADVGSEHSDSTDPVQDWGRIFAALESVSEKLHTRMEALNVVHESEVALTIDFWDELAQDPVVQLDWNLHFFKVNDLLMRYRQTRERFAMSNLRLAYSIARRFMGANSPLEDIVQEANLGLLKAVDRYEAGRGFKFSTYATWWITQRIRRSLDDSDNTIRIPVHVLEKVRKARRHILSSGKKMKETDWQSLATELVLSPTQIEVVKRSFWDPLYVESIHEELDWLIPHGYVELLDESCGPEETVGRIQEKQSIQELLRSLTPVQAQVIKLRFGFEDGEEPMTLEQVGGVLSVTRERIRQIESKALATLRKRMKTETEERAGAN